MQILGVLLFNVPVENPKKSRKTVETWVRSTSLGLTLNIRKTSAGPSVSLADARLSAFRAELH